MSIHSTPYTQEIKELIQQVDQLVISNAEELENFRITYLGAKGILKKIFAKIKEVAPENKKEYGLLVNELKQKLESVYDTHQATLKQNAPSATPQIDFTLPAYPFEAGSRHPIATMLQQIVEIFEQIGFQIADGPEIEDDWHNFTALNFPPEHPARDMQDTYFLTEDKNYLLRTHTSNVQIRVMQNQKPPIRCIMPGRVYRNESISARSHCFFHQIEGLYIDKHVSFSDLKQVLMHFAQLMFGTSKIRLRPSYFPFTEPSAEMDIWKGTDTPSDYKITKGTGWLEVLGCGMVDPQVLQNCGIDPEVYSGFAFGMGIDRITMLKYQIPDIRLLSENDVRFLKQFATI